MVENILFFDLIDLSLPYVNQGLILNRFSF